MAKHKISIAYWRRQAKGWHQVAEHYKHAFNTEKGLRAIEQVEYDTRYDWLKDTYPLVHAEMLTVFPDDIGNGNQLELFD